MESVSSVELVFGSALSVTISAGAAMTEYVGVLMRFDDDDDDDGFVGSGMLETADVVDRYGSLLIVFVIVSIHRFLLD